MITKQDLLEAIAECQGVRSPTANTALKLAAFYTILDHIDDPDSGQADRANQSPQMPLSGYSFANDAGAVIADGDSDFLKAINGRSQKDIWPIVDELMTTIRVMNERLYNGVMRKLQ